ncbi:SAICAR synthase-like protein [Xylaria bambusicola]|uniref:SAICAR synthase-like protein n=1 Tax=Xylaria bambusicola TaxID=326684 RepID=UPI0020075403|nr:SAICAR synthase-like protein [Xylaria bambusicola]KAI0525867.1 SAICAR synthase-like protein [Xylaria bambusicola]
MSPTPEELRELKRAKTAPVKPKDVPKHQDLVGYKHAVAGHDGTMCDADGELFVKPCTQAEVDFYESARLHPDFAELIPVYCGSLALLDTTTAASIHQQLPGLIDKADISKGLKDELKSHLDPDATPEVVNHDSAQEPLRKDAPSQESLSTESKRPEAKTGPIKTDRAITLLNASYGFKKPNIMDAKMGQQLWSKNASMEKRERFDKITESTTHKNFGFRVAGMQVYKGTHPKYTTPDGKEAFSPNVSGPNEEGFMIYNKFWGRDDVNDANLAESLKLYIFNEAAGIDEELGKLVAGLFASDLRRVEEVLQKEESRMYSSSLLFVFEGDGTALRAAIEEAKAAEVETQRVHSEMVTLVNKRASPRAVSTNLRVDSGIGMDDEELKFVAESVVLQNDFEEGSGDDDDEFDEMSTFPHIYSLKMIDFAHAEWTPGLGPDKAVLLGVKSLAETFEKFSE